MELSRKGGDRMLVLSRRPSERILLEVAGVEIWVVFVEQRGNAARIGIDAPDCVNIVREEITNHPPAEAVETKPPAEATVIAPPQPVRVWE